MSGSVKTSAFFIGIGDCFKVVKTIGLVFDCRKIFKKRFYMIFRRIVKNFSGAILTSMAVLLCSCSDGKASANSDYVQASQTLEKAFALFDEGDFVKANELATHADKKVSDIVKKYPDSDVAFKIVSDENLNLGSVRYSHLRKNILPKLNLIAEPDFSEIDIAFAIALFNGNSLELVDLLNDYAKRDLPSNVKKLSPESIENFYNKLLSQVYLKNDASDVEARKKILKSNANLKEFFEAKKSAKKVEAKVVVPYKTLELPQLPPIQNSQKFLKDAEKNAAMANYNLEASKALLDASKFIGKSVPEFEAFAKNLNMALANVKKISSKKLRLPALKNIILAMSQIGLNADALAEIEINPDCKDMKQDCYAVIAQNLMFAGNFKDAQSVIKKIENAKTKNIFYSYLVNLLVEKKDFDTALKVSEEAKSNALLSKILLEKVIYLWDTDNAKALKILAELNPQGISLDMLNKLCDVAKLQETKKLSGNLTYANRYIDVAELLARSNKDASLKWLGLGIFILQNSKEANARILNRKICEVLILIKPNDAVLYAQKLRGVLGFSDINNLANLAVEAGAKEEALSFFEMASALALKPNDVVKLAFFMQISNIARGKILEILKPHLPKLR